MHRIHAPKPRQAACALAVLMLTGVAPVAAMDRCEARTGTGITPVVELYTSQGCSSCPPADRWLAGLPPQDAVIQAFHVAYWDYIGWPDRFAAPAHTARQRQIAAWNGLRSMYTPQVVLDGRDWRQWRSAGTGLPRATGTPAAAIHLARSTQDAFAATVTMAPGAPAAWAAYWTVTESGYRTAVAAGENAGATLHNDHVVRQYTPAGQYRSQPRVPQSLVLHAVAPPAGRNRTVNLVVFDPDNGHTIQALSLACQPRENRPAPGT